MKADLEILKSHEDMCHRAAELFGSIAKESMGQRGNFTVALAGGSTPAGLYIRLHAPPYELDVEWAKTQIFFSDERCVGPEDSSSNYRMAREALLQRVYMDEAKNVHRIKGELGPEEAAADYEAVLAKALGGGMPVFDLVLLGIGVDGHTASLFPGGAALEVTDRPVAPVTETEMKRVTLTLPVINSARNVFIMATGSSKAEIVEEVLEGGNPKGLPAGLVDPKAGKLLWLLDTRAASELSGK